MKQELIDKINLLDTEIFKHIKIDDEIKNRCRDIINNHFSDNILDVVEIFPTNRNSIQFEINEDNYYELEIFDNEIVIYCEFKNRNPYYVEQTYSYNRSDKEIINIFEEIYNKEYYEKV